MSEADDLLRRLVEWEDNAKAGDVNGGAWERWLIDARAYLAREKGPVAEVLVRFFRDPVDNGWRIVPGYAPGESAWVRIPVPKHIYAPEVIEGEVIE